MAVEQGAHGPGAAPSRLERRRPSWCRGRSGWPRPGGGGGGGGGSESFLRVHWVAVSKALRARRVNRRRRRRLAAALVQSRVVSDLTRPGGRQRWRRGGGRGGGGRMIQTWCGVRCVLLGFRFD
jgi:hypothetical protein